MFELIAYECTYACVGVVGKETFSRLCGQLDGSVLKQMKQECGGLKTLLRNHWQVFVGMLPTLHHVC